jgi:hypothetical protein
MKRHTREHESRRHLRRSGLLVQVSVKDQNGRVFQGTILNASESGVGLFTESLPSSELLEIQPANSTLWISVLTKHCSSARSGYIIGCAFQSAPMPKILQALCIPR